MGRKHHPVVMSAPAETSTSMLSRSTGSLHDLQRMTQGVSPNAGQNCPAKTKHCTEKRFIPYQSLPMNLFNEIERGSDNLVIN